MVSYYQAKRNLLIYIEDTLREEGELSYRQLYFKANRNWGFGKTVVDNVIDTMVDAKRAIRGDVSLQRVQ